MGYAEAPEWPTPATSAAGTPTAWNFGQVAAVAADTRGQILVLHRGAHPIMAFGESGGGSSSPGVMGCSVKGRSWLSRPMIG